LSVSKEIRSGVGPHGDHFNAMKVHGRTLSCGGGSSSCAGQVGDDWTHQYRYQEGDWFLIGVRQETWHLSTECDRGQFNQNRNFCPELKLDRSEDCLSLSRSANYITAIQEFKWSIGPAADRDNGRERTINIRKTLAREPLKRLVNHTFYFSAQTPTGQRGLYMPLVAVAVAACVEKPLCSSHLQPTQDTSASRLS